MTVANGRITPVAVTTRVLFDGVPAPILSASASQIVAIVPYATYGKTSAQMDVEYNGGRSAYMTVPLANSAPGIFKNILNSDGSVNSASNPAKKGSYVTFSATGEGIPATLGIDGRLAVTAPYQTPFLPVTVMLNGAVVQSLYAGALPNNAGLMQVNVPLGLDLPSGMVPLVLGTGAAMSPSVSVFLQ
jgi:uncharacterized protein (TIGR03437 family)